MTTDDDKVEVPMIQKEFAEHLGKYRIKKEMVDTIAENIAQVGSPLVFENPNELNQKLGSWSQYIASTTRKQILDHWFAKKGIAISEEMAKQFSLSSTEAKTETHKDERKRKAVAGEVWVVRVDEKGIPRITMAAEDQIGISLEDAKKAVVEIRKAYIGEEPLVTYDETAGKHMPNFKSEFVKQNPMIAWAAAKQMDKAMAEGEELDPMDVFITQMAKTEQVKEALGAKREPEAKGTISELISGVRDLQEMAKEGKAVELPNWMTDPAAFIETVHKVTGVERGTADWMTNPAKFIEMVRTITGEPKADEGVKQELVTLRETLADMKEEKYRDQITALAAQNKAITDKMDVLMATVTEMKRPVTGMTEMDILNKIATEGISLAKAELPGLRGDLRDAFRGGALPPAKSPQEREERKERYRENLDKDKKIEELGRHLFFHEGS